MRMMPRPAIAWRGEVGHYLPLVARLIDQAERRVFAGEAVPAGEKLVSLFETHADIIIKATKVDGVYTADPKKDASATRYAKISFDEAISKNLQVLDATAFALCRDQKLPIKVFSIFKNGALKRVVMGEDEGTLVFA